MQSIYICFYSFCMLLHNCILFLKSLLFPFTWLFLNVRHLSMKRNKSWGLGLGGEREKPSALIVPAKVLHASTASVLTKVS